jgi:Domain of unknown function (DUF3331)
VTEHRCEDVWRQTLSLLDLISGSDPIHGTPRGPSADRKKGRQSRREISRWGWWQEMPPPKWSMHAVTCVERRSSRTIAVCWTDATLGRYGEQVWVLGVARRKSRCAMSGREITRGDPVYRPRLTRSFRPLNAEAMILVASLQGEDASTSSDPKEDARECALVTDC